MIIDQDGTQAAGTAHTQFELPEGYDLGAECHWMLLRLAGRAPDELLARSRDWLARDDFLNMARSITFWAVSYDVALAEAIVTLLSALLADFGADSSGLGQIRIDEAEQLPCWEFAARSPAGLDGRDLDSVLAGEKTRPGPDQAAVMAVQAVDGAVGIWRAWRFPPDHTQWPPPRRVFVVEVSTGVGERGVAAGIQARLADADEESPQVEVYQTGDELPAYQTLARSCGELLWAATKAVDIRVADVFDEISPEGEPLFHADHPRLDPAEAAKVAQDLDSGAILLVTMVRMDDIVDESVSSAVPLNFRTDGTWIWTEASAYYARKHLLGPEPALLAHLRSNDYTVPSVDGVAVYRAMQVLEDPAWHQLEPEISPDVRQGD